MVRAALRGPATERHCPRWAVAPREREREDVLTVPELQRRRRRSDRQSEMTRVDVVAYPQLEGLPRGSVARLADLPALHLSESVQAGGDYRLAAAAAADAGDDAPMGDGVAVQWHPHDRVVCRHGGEAGDETDAEAVGDQGGDGEPLLGVMCDARAEAGGRGGRHEELELVDPVGSATQGS